MPPIVRNLRNLRSRNVRRRSTNGRGVRSFSRYRNTQENQNGNLPDIIQNWWGKFQGFLSFGLQKFSDRLRSTTTTEWLQFILGAGEAIMTFDWQMSDESIDSTIEALNQSLIELGFEAMGRFLAYLVCGKGSTLAIAKFNPALGAFIATQVNPEIKNALATEISSTLSQVAFNGFSQAGLRFFKNWRAGLKAHPDYPVSVVIRTLADVFYGEGTFAKWGNPGNDEWTLNHAGNKLLEIFVPVESWREAVKEGIEAFKETCIDTGFVIAGAIDDWYGQQSYIRENLMGRDRIVEVTPDRSVPEETYILSGSEQALRPAISQLINQTRALNNRDMGTALVTQDYEPVITNNGIELTLEFFNYARPPFWTKERRKKLARSRLTVPNCKRSKITWDNLKQTFGPNIAFQRGDFRMQANLKNGRQLVAWVHTKEEGEKMAEKLVSLTNTEIIFPLEFTERSKYPSNGRYKPKKQEPQYLAFAHIINIPRITKYEERRTSTNQQEIDDKITASKYKAIMHFDKKPSWIDGQISEALRP